MVTLLAETSDMRALRGTGFPGDGEAPVSGGVEPAGRDEAGGSLHISGSCWDHTVALGRFYLIFFSVSRNPNGEGLPHWPMYDQQEGYLQIGATTQAAQKLKDEEVAFFTELLAEDTARKSPQTERIEL